MLNFTIRRALGLIPTMFIIITVCFFFIRLAPGGPFTSEKKIPEHVQERMEAKYGFDKPIFIQYLRYLGGAITGDLGPSTQYKDYGVNYYIGKSLPKSLALGSMAMLLALVMGMGVGMISSLKHNSWIDYSTMSVAVLGISIPVFVIGPLLMLIFAVKLQWLPTSGWIGERGFAGIILPVITLSFPYFATIARLSRASFLESLRSGYVRTAKSKGLSTSVIMFKHVLKGAALPVVSYLGPAFSGIITGAMVIETIFRIPGLGRHFIQSAFNRDWYMIMGTVIVYSFILIVMNFIVDVLYGFLDPRISYK